MMHRGLRSGVSMADRSVQSSPRAVREKKTVGAMVQIYCRANHGTRGPLCQDCEELLKYANARVDSCPLLDDKPTCVKCKIHCYEKSRRERIRTVMRYSGPRMVYRHPILAIRHMMD